ncbi:hypothetical protein EUGRSUZ_D00761 [Eucalyptus grandis]|uniref:Uncharacterized protein n=1 Tax=Eucalyptus grandis TaxID=71139 RepID=A0A059CDY7_EUCGR|nr:hypothetical protein EUGRSUZ_D00761 [Eucalyptus grandis]
MTNFFLVRCLISTPETLINKILNLFTCIFPQQQELSHGAFGNYVYLNVGIQIFCFYWVILNKCRRTTHN